MALMLAPYNDAMRLGMGFNSFTQQLCINDAVKPKGGKLPATEKDLRPVYKLGTMTGVDGSNVDISQDVSWTAKFVDRISEVTDSMNVSGSLQIKCDAIGGGGSASASFIDTNKFKESDINYLIQVKVTNQRLVAPDVNEFSPIDGVPDSEFTRVYGDSFISGFTEGGEFTALVSIKLKDRSQAKDIRGQLKVDLNFQAASVSGDAKVAKTDSSSNVQGETTINVSWRGGGDIKDGTVADWTLETLKAVAMEFPEHVMACPMRTNAIITKYTSLKSFYEKSIKGSPLDYENAGVYSSALLDAYMDYKVMWRNIQTAAWEVEQATSELTARLDIPEFAEMSREAKANYHNQLAHHKRELADYERRYLAQYPQNDDRIYMSSNEPQASSTSADAGSLVIVAAPPAAPEKSANASATLPAPETAPVQTAVVPAASAQVAPSTAPAAPSAVTAAPSSVTAAPSAVTAAPSVAAAASSAPTTTPQAPSPGNTVRRPAPSVDQEKVLAALAIPPAPEPPMPPNDLIPYKANIFGLDKARRDCRFEMIKIVREVDAVAKDPKVACDPSRAWQYLSPAIFRMLIPAVRNLNKEQAALLAAEEAKKQQEEKTKIEQQLRNDLTAAQRKLEATEERLRQVETAKKEMDPWEGCCPMPVNTYIRLRPYLSKKSLDFDWSDGRGSRSVHQYDSFSGHQNQQWTLERVGPIGFAIRHVQSGRYLATGPVGPDNRFYMTTHELATVFLFQPGGGGIYYIRLAEIPTITLNLENGGHDNYAKIIAWPHHPKGECDMWYIKAWDDMNV